MADATVTRLGQVNNAGDVDALFLKLFAGEVLTTFEQKSATLGKHITRNIKGGKSAQFPNFGQISSEYHTVGAEITGLTMPQNERVITIDGLLITHAYISQIDELKSPVSDIRGIYSTEMGRRLAWVYDTNVFRNIVLAARAAGNITDAPGGTEITSDYFKVDPSGASDVHEMSQYLCAAIYQMAQSFDENNVPDEGRYIAFRPSAFYALVQGVQMNGFSPIHQLYGGKGSYAEGDIYRIAGFELIKSNNVPSANHTGDTYHAVDARKTVGVAWTDWAVGTVKLMDVHTEAGWDMRRRATLLLAEYAQGHGILQPECAGEFKLNNLNN